MLLLSALGWTGDLSVDNLTVSKDAAVYGTLNMQVTTATTNGATATGGVITTNGNYRIHTFINSGTFEVLGGASITCDVLVVAGGGGGGRWGGGGGGGGGVIYTNLLSVSGTKNVTVGSGGAGGLNGVNSTAGSNSIFDSIIAYGGGHGGGNGSGSETAGGSGGSGGGSSSGDDGGLGINGQGYAGGKGSGNAPPDYGSGAGGGAGQVGVSGTSTKGGNGGIGIESYISGSGVYYAGGGGGAVNNTTGVVGDGGLGGGGAGSQSDTIPTAGTSNTGGGGGGGGGNAGAGPQDGADGGSGIVIVRYLVNQTTSSNFTTLVVSSNGINQTSESGVNTFMGKVGVGTNNPAEKLHVAGNVQVDGGMTFGGETRTNWPNVAVGALIASNNLSDVTDPSAARSNLGLGSAATNEAGVFLTPSSDGSQLTNITASQVGALSTNAGALIAANHLSELSATAATARSNLGLGSAATSDTSAFDPAGAATTVSNTLSTHASSASNPHQVTAAQVGALSTNGGTANGAISVLSPGGDVPMGVYTNQ